LKLEIERSNFDEEELITSTLNTLSRFQVVHRGMADAKVAVIFSELMDASVKASDYFTDFMTKMSRFTHQN